jgi:tetratricopeptide (TPR) repeat protein
MVTTLAERAARLHAEGMAASDGGRPTVAVRRLRAGLRLVDTAAGDDPDLVPVQGRLLMSLAWAESERGRVGYAFQLLDDAEPLVPDDQRPILFAQRALLLKRSGRYVEALRQFDRALALLSEQSRPLDLVKALNNRSLVHLDVGQLREARADLHRCGQIAARHGLALHVAFSQVNLGCLDVVAGDLPSALGAFAAARAKYETLAPGRLANLAVERSRALVAAGLFGEADHELAYAMEHAARQRLTHTYADALHVRAEAALLASRPQAAAEWARQARARFRGRDNARRAAIASLLELRAEFAAGAEQPGTIAGRARRLAARLLRLDLPEDARVAGLVAARALVATGQSTLAGRVAARYGAPGRVDRLDTRLLWRLARAELATVAGRPAEASRHLAAGMSTLHRHRTQFGCLDLQTGAAVHGRDLARAGLAAALASGSPAAIYRWAERARAQALLLPPVRPPADATVAAALEELRQLRYAMRTAELAGQPASDPGSPLGGGWRAGKTPRARIEALQRTIRERAWSVPGRRGAAGPALARFTELKEELAGAALVYYLRDGPWLRALVVAGGSATLVTTGEYAAAQEAVLRLRADLDAQAGRAMPRRLAEAVASATRRDARALAATILDPLRGLVGDRALVVVPTGVLITVPWSILPGCAGRPVTVAPSATSWHAARRRRAAAGRAVVVAGPGIQRGDAEVAAVAKLHPDATVLTGAGATPAATLAALDGAAVAHLAAHGHHQAENALFSTLDLAGGPLLGYDLQHVARTPPMVVLSSCDLGLADVRPGDETLGMVTALLAAGSATVVASVARIADETAMAVMTSYHRAIADGHPPAAALAEAGTPTAAVVCFGAG